MPWGSIGSQIAENGFWAMIGALAMTGAFVIVGFFNNRTKENIALDANKLTKEQQLAERENKLIEHLVAEVSRLNTLVTNLDQALQEQGERHRSEMQRERDECNAKILGLQGEIDILKGRMANEEQRDA